MSINIKRLSDILDKFFNYQSDELWIMPEESEVEFEKISHIMKDCFLVEYRDENFKFSYMGDNLVNALSDENIGDDVSKIILPSDHQVLENLKKIIKSKKPESYEGEFVNSNNILIKFRTKIYPLTDNISKQKIKYLFGGMRWKEEI
jgi:hypothetical protein